MIKFKESWSTIKQEFKKFTWLDYTNLFFYIVLTVAAVRIFSYFLITSMITWVMVAEQYKDILSKETLDKIPQIIRWSSYHTIALIFGLFGFFTTNLIRKSKRNKEDKLKKEITEKVKHPKRKSIFKW